MDSLTITGSMVAILATASKAAARVQGLLTLDRRPDIILTLLTEINIFHATLQQLSNLFKDHPEIYTDESDTDGSASMPDFIVECGRFLRSLDEDLAEVTRNLEKGRFFRRTKHLWHEDRFRQSLEQLRAYATHINMLLQVVQLKQFVNATKLPDAPGTGKPFSIHSHYSSLQKQKNDHAYEMSGSDIDSVNTILSDKVFGFDDIIVNSAAYRRAMRFEKNAESGSNNTVETFAGRPPTVPGSRSKIEKMLVLNALRPSGSAPTSAKSASKSLRNISPTTPTEINSRDRSTSRERIEPRLQLHHPNLVLDSVPTGVENYIQGDWAAITPNVQQTQRSPSISECSDADSEYLSHSEDEYSIRSAPTIHSGGRLNSTGPLNTTTEVVDALARRLYEDETLKLLCSKLVQDGIVNKIRLQRNFRRLLQHFSTHLNLEAETETERLLVRILRERSSSISTEFCHRAFNRLPVGKEARELNTSVSLTDTQAANKQVIDKGKSKMTSSQWNMEQEWHSSTTVFNPNIVDLVEPGAIQYGFHVEKDSTAKNTDLDLSEDSADMKFMFSSSAIQYLRVGLQQFLYPGYNQMMDGLKRRIAQWKHSRTSKEDLDIVLNDLQEADPKKIRISYIESRLSLVDHLKNLVEEITLEEWEWWPLSRPRRTIKEGEAKISWKCGCGDERWAIVPYKFARILARIVNKSLTRNAKQWSNFNDVSAGSLNVVDSLGTRKRQTGIASSGQPGASDDRPVSEGPGTKAASARDVNLNIVGSGQSPFSGHRGLRSPLTGGVPGNTSKEFDANNPLYVFLVVHVGDDYRLSQLKIEAQITTDNIFHMIRAEYIRLRGPIRRWLSIWGYSHCDFFRFAKFREAEFVPEGIDFPHKKMLDYRFAPRPINPSPPKGPIGRHEFHARFYRCYKPRSLLHLFHKCRKACNSKDAVSLFPKRVRQFEEGGDEREKFWGIYAQERRWFISVVIYNFLCMLPSIIFVFLWLFVWDHPADLQGATGPFIASLSMLSLFWGYIFTSDNRL